MPESAMPEETKRGDHEYVNAHLPEQCQAGLPPRSVFDAELAVINERRQQIKNIGSRDRTGCPRTGLAISGGGIRSASFGLGALQGLEACAGLEVIDLSLDGLGRRVHRLRADGGNAKYERQISIH